MWQINMKKALYTAIIAFMFSLSVQSCFPVNFSENRGSLDLLINFNDVKSSTPGLIQNNFSFIITGKGPGSSSFRQETNRGVSNARAESLIPGTWNITVEALYYNESRAVSFGDGTASILVKPGESTQCSIGIAPFNGIGTLNIRVNWDSARVSNPVLLGSLTRFGYSPLYPAFTLNSGEAAASMELPGGIYTCEIQLKDGDIYIYGGAADSVRITNLLTTNMVCTIAGETGQGEISIFVNINIPSPIIPSIIGGNVNINYGESMNLAGSTPGESGVINYHWYLNGSKQGEGISYSVPQSLNPGDYRIDLIVYNNDYLRGGSASFSFTVLEAD